MPSRKRPALSHVDESGRVRMVDVGAKAVTAREAIATGRVTMSPATISQIRAGNLKKGDPLQTARLAGIMAAKRPPELVPRWPPRAVPVGGGARGAAPLRHAQGDRQGDRDFRQPVEGETRRPQRALSRVTILGSIHSSFRMWKIPRSQG